MVLALSAVFFLFFQLTKQIPALASANASANDPYDAIGSFGIQAAAFFGLLAVGRCFWWSRGNRKLSLRNRLLIVRAEIASVLAVVVTLAGDIIAMLRRPALWIGSSAGRGYAVLAGGMAVLALSISLYAGLASRGVRGPRTTPAWLWAASSILAFVAVLVAYPESLRASLAGELFSVLVGVVLLFAPTRFLLLALVPDPALALTEPAAATLFAPRWLPWAAVAAAGVVAGLLLVSAEMFKESGGPAPPVARLLLVVSVYTGLEAAGLLVGYALLRGPVGLALSPNGRIEHNASR